MVKSINEDLIRQRARELAALWNDPGQEDAIARAVAPLVEALEPFALIAEYDIGADESDGDDYRPMQRHNVVPRVTVGHLRQALAALAAFGKGKSDAEN